MVLSDAVLCVWCLVVVPLVCGAALLGVAWLVDALRDGTVAGPGGRLAFALGVFALRGFAVAFLGLALLGGLVNTRAMLGGAW